MIYLPMSAFLDRCCNDYENEIQITALNLGDCWTLNDSSCSFALCNSRDPLRARHFATLDAAFSACRKVVSPDHPMRLRFQAV